VTEKVTVTWDGKNFAAVQTATVPVPRRCGCPVAELHGGELRLAGIPVPPGTEITVGDGLISWPMPDLDIEVEFSAWLDGPA
jgi:hypothetical protein